MYAKITALIGRFWKRIVGFISVSSVIRLIHDLLQDRRDSFINQSIDRWVSKVDFLQSLAYPVGWIADNFILVTILSTCVVVIALYIAAYRETRKHSEKRADIEGEILHIILEDKLDADFRSVKIATFVALGLHVTNRSPVMVSIIYWSLEVQIGKVKATAKKIDIPPQARRELPTTPFVPKEIEPLESLDKKCRETPLKQNVPMHGWLLFELRSVDIPDPRNGRLIIHITDNLSQTHEIIREANPFPLSGKLVWQE